MIGYITNTGVFGIFWIILTLLFPVITYKFIKRNPKQAIPTILPVAVGLLFFNIIATELIGKTQFDLALTLIKDLWFLAYHIFFIAAYLIVDRDLINNLFAKKEVKGE